jgi:hypothetical protein
VSETQGGFAPTGQREVGISPRAVLDVGRIRKAVLDGEASASCCQLAPRTSSFYSWSA